MYLDVQTLRNFYYRSSLGRAAQRVIRGQVRAHWPGAKGQTVVGYGFAAPLLRPYLGEARRVVGLMPAAQGVMPWPVNAPNTSVLCEEMLWPLDTGAVDKLVLMHGLETATNPDALLAEAYRVLGPGGSAVFVVPNRAGMWSRSDATPFGFGRPYTPGQLEAQLRTHGFAIEQHSSVLYQPPSGKRFWLRTSAMWEKFGRSIPVALAGGVLVVEASKQVPAPKKPGLGERVKKPLSVLEGMGLAEPEPSRRTGAGR